MTSNRNITGFVLFTLVAAGCGPAYTMDPPKSFKRYQETEGFKMITADGVMLKAREVENYPEGDLPFWTDATERHLVKRGYVLKSKACFKTQKQKDACTLTFLLPHGAEDWVFSETLFVEGDTLVLVEAAGPFQRFVKVEKELAAALKTFEPNLN